MKANIEKDAIPDGWQRVRLGDVARLGSGKTPPYDNEAGTVPVLGSNGPIGLARESNFSNGLAVGRVGASGSIQHVREAVWLSDNVLFVDPKIETCNLSFLCNALQTADLPGLASKTAQPLITQSDLSAVKFLLPPLPEQRAIAAVLDSIDDAIEGAEAVIAATEGLRDALLHDLLTRGLPGQHTEFRDVPGLGTIPADWEVVRLGDVATVERGKFGHRPRNEPRFYGGDIPFIQTGDVVKSTGKIKEHSQTLNELGLSISKLFPAGTIVITIAANIGETAITSYPVAFPDSLVGITSNCIDTNFLEYFLRTRKAYLNELAPESAQKNINLEDLRPLLTPFPHPAEQFATAELLNGVEASVKVAREECGRLRLLKESAAGALLAGLVRVEGTK